MDNFKKSPEPLDQMFDQTWHKASKGNSVLFKIQVTQVTYCSGLVSVVVLKIFFSRTNGPILTKFVMITKERSIKIVNFLFQGVAIYKSYSENVFNFFKNLFQYSQAQIRQIKCIVMMTKAGSIKIVNFMTPRAVVFVIGTWPRKSYIENACFL